MNIERQIPYVCPVCVGNGLVPNGFYRQLGGQWTQTDITPEQCKSCKGTGIIMGKEIEIDCDLTNEA